MDPAHAGQTVADVMPHLGSRAPFVAGIREGLAHDPDALLIGTAPQGGGLPPSWRSNIAEAIAAKLEIVSGLHDMLADDAEFAGAATAHGTSIWDVRRPPAVPLFSGAAYNVKAPVVLTVGNDCAVGKMTVALELAAAARTRGTNAAFVPTGQTGIMIAGWGISVDRVVSDFASGAAEQLVVSADAGHPDLIVVEGQGAINHPAYAPVTLALLFGCAPDALLLVCEVPHERMSGFETPALGYRELIRLHEAICATVKPAPVVGIALNTRGISDDRRAQLEIQRARRETGLPVDDLVRFGSPSLYAEIAPRIAKSTALTKEKIA